MSLVCEDSLERRGALKKVALPFLSPSALKTSPSQLEASMSLVLSVKTRRKARGLKKVALPFLGPSALKTSTFSSDPLASTSMQL